MVDGYFEELDGSRYKQGVTATENRREKYFEVCWEIKNYTVHIQIFPWINI